MAREHRFSCPGQMHLFAFDTGMKKKKVLNQCIQQMNLGYQVSYSKQKGLCYGLQMLSDAFQGGFLLISCVIAVSSIQTIYFYSSLLSLFLTFLTSYICSNTHPHHHIFWPRLMTLGLFLLLLNRAIFDHRTLIIY